MPSGQEEQDAVVAAALAADAPPQAVLLESAAAAPGLERWYRCWSEGCSRRTLSPIAIAGDWPHFVCSMECYYRATPQWLDVRLDLENMDRQMGEASHSAAMPPEPRPPAAPHYLKLYFAELGGEVHGPMHFAPDERVEHIEQWLEEETFQSLCVDDATNDWGARVEISTSRGAVLIKNRTLDEYPIRDGDTLTVVIVPDVPEESQEAASVRPDA